MALIVFFVLRSDLQARLHQSGHFFFAVAFFFLNLDHSRTTASMSPMMTTVRIGQKVFEHGELHVVRWP